MRVSSKLRRALAFASLALVAGCSGARELEPSHGHDRGGETLRIHGHDFAGHGGVIVDFAGSPGHAAVIESDRVIRVTTPKVAPEQRGQALVVTLEFADGEQRQLAATYLVEAGPVEVRARD